MASNITEKKKRSNQINFALYRIKGMITQCENIKQLPFINHFDSLSLTLAKNQLRQISKGWQARYIKNKRGNKNDK